MTTPPETRRTLPAPARVSRSALALGVVALCLFGIARTTGSGWLIVVLTGIASVVGLAAVLPPFALARVTVRVEPPRDATVGRPTSIAVDVGGPAIALTLRLEGFGQAWSGAVVPVRGHLDAVPQHRGVFDTATVEIRSAAPLGLVCWRRRLVVALARPIDVGPQPLAVDATPPSGRSPDGSEAMTSASALADAVRTTREYVAGDPIKLVHWAATARTGELMVKELESHAAPVLFVEVDLRDAPSPAVEQAASRAAGLVLAALRAGLPVLLSTCERTGPRVGPVGAPVEAGRRLARAVPGALAPRPRGVGAEAVVITAREATR